MFNLFRLLGLKPNRKPKAETQDSSARHIANANVGSRISSCPTKQNLSIQKHWSEMSIWEKIEAGPFVCILNPDEYDKRWGIHLEYFVLFKCQEDYDWQKNYVKTSGRWDEFCHQNGHHKI
jgi:hypothetical protein